MNKIGTTLVLKTGYSEGVLQLNKGNLVHYLLPRTYNNSSFCHLCALTNTTPSPGEFIIDMRSPSLSIHNVDHFHNSILGSGVVTDLGLILFSGQYGVISASTDPKLGVPCFNDEFLDEYVKIYNSNSLDRKFYLKLGSDMRVDENSIREVTVLIGDKVNPKSTKNYRLESLSQVKPGDLFIADDRDWIEGLPKFTEVQKCVSIENGWIMSDGIGYSPESCVKVVELQKI